MKANQSLLNIGQFLKDKREEKNLSIKDLSVKTCISVEMLKALESGDIEKLPVYVYLRGFILAYAKEVKIKEKDILQEIKLLNPVVSSVAGDGGGELSSTSDPDSNVETEELHLMPIVTAVCILLVLAGVLIFLNMSRQNSSNMSLVSTTNNEEIEEVVATKLDKDLSKQEQNLKSNNQSLATNTKKQEQPEDFFSSVSVTAPLEIVVKALEEIHFSYKLDDKNQTKTMLLKKDHFEVLKAQKRVWISTKQSSKIQILKNGKNLGVFGSGGAKQKLFKN